MKTLFHVACSGRMAVELCRHYTNSGHDDVTAIECTRCGQRNEMPCKTCARAMHPAGKGRQ